MLTIHHTSEHSLLCLAEPPAELAKQQQIWRVAEQARALDGVLEVVVGMNNFTLFHAIGTDSTRLIQAVQQLWENDQAQAAQSPRLIEIPVHYGGEFGEDLFEVAQFHNTTPEEIIRRHTEPTYTVFMIGFQPAFLTSTAYRKIYTPHAETCLAPKSLPVRSASAAGKQAFIPLPHQVAGNC
ncbi:5-oxoprolinase subunit B [Mannheimia haemolytica]